MLVVDIETSGTHPFKHSILSIGALDYYNPTNQFYGECRIWDGAHIMKEALLVNGFSAVEAESAEKQSEADLFSSFTRFALQVPEHTLAGQNPGFDRFFLEAAAGRAHLPYPFAHRTIDLHSVCYYHALRRGIKPPSKNGRSDLNSDAVSEYAGIPKERRPHNALSGAKQAAECFSRLIAEQPLLPEFNSFLIPWLKPLA